MEWKDIDRVRHPGFTVARRGYDQREVDRFLSSLAEWLETDASKQLGDLAVKRKLELVGKTTTRILTKTEEEAAELRRLVQQECVELRDQADTASRETRQAADEYARATKAKAAEDARTMAEAAAAKARQIVEEAEHRRAQIEAVVQQLESVRDGTIEELEQLHGELASTIQTHRPAASSGKQSAGHAAKPARARDEIGSAAKG